MGIDPLTTRQGAGTLISRRHADGGRARCGLCCGPRPRNTHARGSAPPSPSSAGPAPPPQITGPSTFSNRRNRNGEPELGLVLSGLRVERFDHGAEVRRLRRQSIERLLMTPKRIDDYAEVGELEPQARRVAVPLVDQAT
jgi:hypothetical protein